MVVEPYVCINSSIYQVVFGLKASFLELVVIKGIHILLQITFTQLIFSLDMDMQGLQPRPEEIQEENLDDMRSGIPSAPTASDFLDDLRSGIPSAPTTSDLLCLGVDTTTYLEIEESNRLQTLENDRIEQERAREEERIRLQAQEEENRRNN